MVELARQLRRPDPDCRPVPQRKVAAALAERGYVASKRLAAADLIRVTSGGSSLGNAFPPVATASLT
jgi:hypothetical protein